MRTTTTQPDERQAPGDVIGDVTARGVHESSTSSPAVHSQSVERRPVPSRDVHYQHVERRCWRQWRCKVRVRVPGVSQTDVDWRSAGLRQLAIATGRYSTIHLPAPVSQGRSWPMSPLSMGPDLRLAFLAKRSACRVQDSPAYNPNPTNPNPIWAFSQKFPPRTTVIRWDFFYKSDEKVLK